MTEQSTNQPPPQPPEPAIPRGANRQQSLGGMSWGVLIGVVALAVVFWLVMTRTAPDPARHPAVGREAPTFDLVQLIPGRALDDQAANAEEANGAAGSPPTLRGIPLGTVTLLHFWGTWCPPCRLEYPELVEMVQAFASEPRFRFVTVSCGGGGPEDYAALQAQTAQYYQSIGAGELETYADLQGRTRQSLAEQLDGAVAYPTTVMLSSGGRIAGVWIGYAPSGVGEMRQVAEELLLQQQQTE